MTRNMDLIRTILLAVEALAEEAKHRRLRVDGFDDFLVSDHLELLAEAGFVLGLRTNDAEGWVYMPGALTWEGHNFLDTIRDQGIWTDTKRRLAEVGGTATAEMIMSVATQLTRKKLGLGN